MLYKYEVGTEEDGCLGVYYAETEEEALDECRQDHLYLQDGTKLTHRSCGVPTKNLLHKLIANKVG